MNEYILELGKKAKEASKKLAIIDTNIEGKYDDLIGFAKKNKEKVINSFKIKQ